MRSNSMLSVVMASAVSISVIGTAGGCSSAPASSGDEGGGASAGSSGAAGAAASGYCARWKSLASKALPGFRTDSECVDFGDLPTHDAPCSGMASNTAVITKIGLAQTHLLEPSSARYDTRDDGSPLVPIHDEGQLLPKFRLASHRPALLKVDVAGSGPSPEVRVTAYRNGQQVGSLCLTGPASLVESAPATPNLTDAFTVSLPAAWLRRGLSLAVQAGEATTEIAAADLAIAGGLRHHVVEMPYLMWGNVTPQLVQRFTREMLSDLPVQSLIWSRFPVPVTIDPVVIEPGVILATPGGGFDTIAVAISTAGAIQRANGMSRESKYYGALDAPRGGGLGGGNAAGGDADVGIMHHELGHAYGLPHLGGWYEESKYPFAGGREIVGGSVGPLWAYDQFERQLFSPYLPEEPSFLRQDPMQSGHGQQDAGRAAMFFGAFSAQVILEHFQDRSFWDDETGQLVVYDAVQGEFVPAPVENEGYFSVRERDVPVFTIFGSYARDEQGELLPEGTVIQPYLHYRGNLMKGLDITNADDVAYLREEPGALCYWGCDYTVRVTYDDATTAVATLQQDTKPGQLVRWAVNFPAGRALPKKAEFFFRALAAQHGSSSPSHPSLLDATTALDTATLVASKTF